jgi:hypothetical protein
MPRKRAGLLFQQLSPSVAEGKNLHDFASDEIEDAVDVMPLAI